MSEIWAIVLAAGASTRMKKQKLLLPYDGKTMIEQVILNVISSRVDHTLVVVGCDKDQILGAVNHLPVSFCHNDAYNRGMLSSVKMAFRTLPEQYDAALVFQGDQPLITPGAVNVVIDAYRQSGKGIVIPVYNQRRGHPVLIDHKYREEIDHLDASVGLRDLACKFPGDVLEVAVNLPGILIDLDTREEYLKVINLTETVPGNPGVD